MSRTTRKEKVDTLDQAFRVLATPFSGLAIFKLVTLSSISCMASDATLRDLEKGGEREERKEKRAGCVCTALWSFAPCAGFSAESQVYSETLLAEKDP